MNLIETHESQSSVSIYPDKYMLKNLPDVMDINQVSDILGISSKTGYEMLKTGKIAYLKIGRSYRIPKAKLIDFLDSAGVRKKHKM